MSPRSSFVHLSIALYACSALASSSCYMPNSQTQTINSDKPCNASAAVSQCCGSTDACLSNGLCKIEATEDTGSAMPVEHAPTGTGTVLFMEIIDQDTPFNSSAYDFHAGDVQIWECGAQGYAEEATYCCESEGERQRCCSTSSAVFRLDGATIGAFTGPPASSSVSITHTSYSISTTGSSTTATPATRTRSSFGSTLTNAQTGSEIQNSNMGLKIEAGIGGAVGGCLLLAAAISHGKLAPRIIQGTRQREGCLWRLSTSGIAGFSRPSWIAR
ncbi:hypothetical protein K505DRAFT_340721 [Melanomma pulvis-pyrius CBS 109.77]|uniref:Uncharacterized protein n=1 Tax=Melanomma pulvis-pyrius CBS 109.77 TaxID=1314802 RepID=A0A6A6X0T9_9PLEO|nr:hypothetical protein K505DRAFT_340721 [Melanomma pulvis-pyrius CBS 109.77]